MINKQQSSIARCLNLVTAAVLCLTIIGILSNPLVAYADEIEDANNEYKIKVAYIYNFGRYMKWSKTSFADKKSPFIIGIIGDAPFGDILQKLAKARKIHGRQIKILRFKSPKDYKPCQILFVTKSVDAKARKKTVLLTKSKQVLIVGETEGFAQKGAEVNFYYDSDDDTIGFNINVDSLKRRRLMADARLLKLAHILSQHT